MDPSAEAQILNQHIYFSFLSLYKRCWLQNTCMILQTESHHTSLNYKNLMWKVIQFITYFLTTHNTQYQRWKLGDNDGLFLAHRSLLGEANVERHCIITKAQGQDSLGQYPKLIELVVNMRNRLDQKDDMSVVKIMVLPDIPNVPERAGFFFFLM